MKPIYKIHHTHKRKINLLGGFDKIGLKKYNGPDPVDDVEDLVYNWYDDWYCMVVIEDKKKFNYNLIKHPDLFKYLNKIE